MRLLFVNYEYPPLGGGGGVAHRDIAEALAKRHDIHVLTTHFPGLPRLAVEHGVTIHRVPVWGRTALPTATLRSMLTFAPAALYAGRTLSKQLQPELIHAFFAVPSGVPGVLLGRWTRVPVVLTLVGADIFDPHPTAGVASHRNPLVRRAVRWAIRHATAVTAISADTKERAIALHGAPLDTRVLPLGFVPPQELPPAAPATGSVLRLVTVGRLIPRKGLQDLLEALALLAPLPLLLTVVGDGPLRGPLEQSARMRGLADRVRFVGQVDEAEKWRLLRSADVYVSPSLHEGFGIVFVEAMYAGLPIVATDRGGQRDLLSPYKNALLVPPGQPDVMAAELRRIHLDESLRQRLAAAGRATVRRFLIDRIAGAYEAFFAEVVRGA